MINPAFINFPDEAALIGAMVVGYGELELSYGALAGDIIGDKWSVLKAFHYIRSEMTRIDVANALCETKVVAMGFADEYAQVLTALKYCREVRNRYTHQQWGDMDGMLCITKAEAAFQKRERPTWYTLDLALIEAQEAFFEYTRLCILTLHTCVDYHRSGKARPVQRRAKQIPPPLHKGALTLTPPPDQTK